MKTKTKLIVLAALVALPLQAEDKFLDEQGRVISREQAEAAKLSEPWKWIVSISPDGHWLFCHAHYGSHWGENYLYRSDDGVQFGPARKESDEKELEARRRYAREGSNASHIESAENFDDQAWKFFCKAEGVSSRNTEFVDPAEFVSWTPDGNRLLFSLTSRLGLTLKELDAPPRPSNSTASGSISPRADPKKLGVEDWRAYFNLKTKNFELTDELRATNKEARKRWREGKQLEPRDLSE